MERRRSSRAGKDALLEGESLDEHFVNPFEHTVEFTSLRKIQVVLMSVTIAPVRFLCMLLVVVLAYLVAFISTIGLELEVKHPVRRWRRLSILILQPIMRVLFFFMGVLWIEQKGKPAKLEEAFIYVLAPHSTFYDAVPCSTIAASAVAKKEILAAPFIGTLMKTIQPVMVLRPDPQSRQDTIGEIQRRAASSEKWPQVLIFPEGTCTNRKALITFKGGAFIPGVSVQPVVLRYPNTWDTYTWTMIGPSTLKSLWLSLCQFYIRFQVEYLPPYHPSKEEKEDPKLFAENVRKVMADALSVPVTDHTYEDCRLMYRAEDHKLPLETGLVEFSKLNRIFGIDIDEMKVLLNDFASALTANKNALMGVDDFAKYLNVPVTDPVQDLFNTYDRRERGALSFRDFVIGWSLVSAEAATEKVAKMAFKVFDINGDGYVSQDEATHILKSVFGPGFEADKIFAKMDEKRQGKVSYEEFFKFAKKHPNYAKLFMSCMESEKKEEMSLSVESFREKYRRAEANASCKILDNQRKNASVRNRKLIENKSA